ncbi:MAG TPA: hypothetical protein VHX66_17460 [Solirubrobacteraceae bacterium]|nr:hypothetical protein [Solirubrobacteraceae bacterium]
MHNVWPSANNPFGYSLIQDQDGPQTANVPTLAWVGEDVRLVACDDTILPVPFDGQVQQAEWNTKLWTGDQATQSTPVFDGSQATNLFITDQGSPYFFFPNAPDNFEKGCVSADISSLHAGLDEVTLNVYDENLGGGGGQDSVNGGGLSGGPDQYQVYSEQFIVIWMTANNPTLKEAGLSDIEFPTQAGDNGAMSTAVEPSTGPNGPDANGASVGQLTGTGVKNATAFLGDTAVLGQFGLDAWGADQPFDPWAWDGGANNTPETNNGLVQVRVTGSFPIEDQPPATTNESYFSSITGGGNPSSITLPNEWPQLAAKMAASSIQYPSNASGGNGTTGGFPAQGGNLWDIHGGPTNALTHAGSASGVCAGDGTTFNSTTDAVDDCVTSGGGDVFAFSRVFGDVTNFGTIGPYDPLAANGTLLSDGRLNTDDAPMPALPVTVSIANGGVGGLYGVSKTLVYSHDFNGNASPSNPDPAALTSTGLGNLYNPFYQEYIPSTDRGIAEASGVTGVAFGGFTASSGDDFPGFSLGWTDPYTFWKALNVSSSDTGGSNGCLRATKYDHSSDQGPEYYQLPDYPTQLTVYTDERGEAYVDYNPGTGFPTPNVTIDNNGACDLQNLLGKTIGTASISAQAEYPYESVPYQAPASVTPVTKNVVSQWSKTLTAYPKNNLSGDASVVVASATDVNGQPFAGETVCFAAPGGNLSIDTATSITTPAGTTISLAGSKSASTPKDVGPTYLCGVTGVNGTIGVDVQGSTGAVDVTALFYNEGLFRDITVTPGQSTTVTSTTPPTVIPAFKIDLQSGSSSTSTTAGSTAVAQTPTGQVTIQTQAIPGKAASCKVASFHMFAKKAYAKVKLSCTGTKSDNVLVRTFKGHKLVGTTRVRIKAGKSVTIHFKRGRRISVSA